MKRIAQPRTVSPRELARALGVSESSMKRWIDAGRIPAWRTAGGHRRIDLAPALRFLHESGQAVVHPEPLGIGPAPITGDELTEQIHDAVESGRAPEARSLLLGAYAAGWSVADLCDGPLRGAMERVGELWDGGARSIVVEHRATQLCIGALSALRDLFEPDAEGLVAMGGAIDDDPSQLPTLMASAVLAAEGIYPVDLGPSIPPAALVAALDQVQPELVWLSVSYLDDPARQSAAYRRLFEELGRRHVPCVLGGRHADALELPDDTLVLRARSMAELAAFARLMKTENDR